MHGFPERFDSELLFQDLWVRQELLTVQIRFEQALELLSAFLNRFLQNTTGNTAWLLLHISNLRADSPSALGA